MYALYVIQHLHEISRTILKLNWFIRVTRKQWKNIVFSLFSNIEFWNSRDPNWPTNFLKTIAVQAKIFQGKLFNTTFFIPYTNPWTFIFPILPMLRTPSITCDANRIAPSSNTRETCPVYITKWLTKYTFLESWKWQNVKYHLKYYSLHVYTARRK